MKYSLFFLATLPLLFSACHSGKSDGRTGGGTPHEQVADTTIYGTSSEFGMSTFSLITDAGDTLDLDRGDGHIYGNLDNEGDRFALTVRGQGTDTASVGVAINLANVEQFTKDYAVWNGHLVLAGDTVEILDLTADSLIARGRKEYRFGK